jgi:hypothetical protein
MRQSVNRRGFLAAMAAMSAAVGAFALSVRGASAAAWLDAVPVAPPSSGAPADSCKLRGRSRPGADLVARNPHTIREHAMPNQMPSATARLATLEGPLSVSGAPNLPVGFIDIFTSRFVAVGGTGDVRLHAVIGGFGPPLLIHGWPGSWYYARQRAWRFRQGARALDRRAPSRRPGRA